MHSFFANQPNTFFFIYKVIFVCTERRRYVKDDDDSLPKIAQSNSIFVILLKIIDVDDEKVHKKMQSFNQLNII